MNSLIFLFLQVAITPTCSPLNATSVQCTCIAPTPTPVPLPKLYTDAKVKWEANMEKYGRQFCEAEKTAVNRWQTLYGQIDPATGKPYQYLVDACMSYYDGEEVFYNIAEYKKSKGEDVAYWLDCAQTVEKCYRGSPLPPGTATTSAPPYGYVHGNRGGTSGYWGFSLGMLRDFLATGDVDSKSAIQLLATNAAYAIDSTPLSYTMKAGTSREVAYAKRHYLNAERAGFPHRARYDTLLEVEIGAGTPAQGTLPATTSYLDQWILGTYRAPNPWPDVPAAAGQYYFQPFMAGLTMRTLIMGAAQHPDPRIYPAVKRLMEYVNQVAWVKRAPVPGKTEVETGGWWYQKFAPTQNDMIAAPQPDSSPDLNNLILPALGWLYQQDGDSRWLEYGDKAFSDAANYAYFGTDKHFNQNFTWSPDYVKWREAVRQ